MLREPAAAWPRKHAALYQTSSVRQVVPPERSPGLASRPAGCLSPPPPPPAGGPAGLQLRRELEHDRGLGSLGAFLVSRSLFYSMLSYLYCFSMMFLTGSPGARQFCRDPLGPVPAGRLRCFSSTLPLAGSGILITIITINVIIIIIIIIIITINTNIT